MNIVYSGDAATKAFKEKLFQVVVGNEVGVGLREQLAYSISFATREDQSKSGWSFGWTQHDLGQGKGQTAARTLLARILEQATVPVNRNGPLVLEFVVGEGQKDSDRKALVKELVGKASQKSRSSLSADEQAQITQALSSE